MAIREKEIACKIACSVWLPDSSCSVGGGGGVLACAGAQRAATRALLLLTDCASVLDEQVLRAAQLAPPVCCGGEFEFLGGARADTWRRQVARAGAQHVRFVAVPAHKASCQLPVAAARNLQIESPNRAGRVLWGSFGASSSAQLGANELASCRAGSGKDARKDSPVRAGAPIAQRQPPLPPLPLAATLCVRAPGKLLAASHNPVSC